MSFVGIQSTVNLYTMQESSLTYELSGILMDITRATSKCTDVGESYAEEKEAIVADGNADATYKASAQYQADLDDARDDYELQLSQINEWECELESRKQALQTEIQATSSYKESFMAAEKENIQKDFKYADSGS